MLAQRSTSEGKHVLYFTPARNVCLACHRLLVVHFDLEAEVFDHAPDFGGWLAWCREVTVYEDGVGWIEGERLEGSEIMFAASGNAKFSTRVEETEEAEDFQTSLWCEIVAVL